MEGPRIYEHESSSTVRRLLGRYFELVVKSGPHDPAYRQSAPDHGVVVVVALAADYGDAQRDGFGF